MNGQYLSIEKLGAYQASLKLSNYVWEIISCWNYFEKDTVGKQFVRAADSVSANIAEGYGRYYKKDKIKFYYYSLGSILECKDWTYKCKMRSIISNEEYVHIINELNKLPIELRHLINFTNQKLKY